MKKIAIYFLALSCLGIIFYSCNSTKKNKALIVTIEPQKYFLSQIVGDKYDIDVLIGSNGNPESYEPTPSQMMALENCEAYFRLGLLNFESILLEKIRDKNKLRIFNCSDNVTILDNHDHSNCGHSHDNVTTHLKEKNSNTIHGHDQGDPHYWSSIESAKIMLGNMYDAMCEIDPSNEYFYTTNYAIAKQKLIFLEDEIRFMLHSSPTKAFVIYHPALSYFAKEFDLLQLSIENEGKTPSPLHMKNIIDEAIANNVRAVFIQKEFDEKNAETIAKQIDCKTFSINLMDYEWDKTMMNITKHISGIDEK